jgi:hypothetical protein
VEWLKVKALSWSPSTAKKEKLITILYRVFVMFPDTHINVLWSYSFRYPSWTPPPSPFTFMPPPCDTCLCEAYFTYFLHFHLTLWFPVLFFYKQHNFIFLYGWLYFHCVYVPHFLYLLIYWWTPKLIP